MTSARRFHGLPESVPAARRFTRDALRDQSSEVVDAAELMVSELATNCVQHARTDFEITIDTRDQVRVEVRDADHDGRPEVQSPPPEAPSGRGLRIVQEISDEWGIAKSSDGKTVWFVLNPPSAASRDQSRARASEGGPPDGSARATKVNVLRAPHLLRFFRRGPKASGEMHCMLDGGAGIAAAISEFNSPFTELNSLCTVVIEAGGRHWNDQPPSGNELAVRVIHLGARRAAGSIVATSSRGTPASRRPRVRQSVKS